MKKSLLILAAVLLALPLTVGSVTWQMDSAPFTFPGTGAEKAQQAVSAARVLTCHFDAVKGSAVFQCRLPLGVKSAKLSMYNISGAQIGSMDVKAGGSTVEWRASGSRVPAGIYVAVLRYGTAEHKTQFSIVN
jgi:hypothetical protein